MALITDVTTSGFSYKIKAAFQSAIIGHKHGVFKHFIYILQKEKTLHK